METAPPPATAGDAGWGDRPRRRRPPRRLLALGTVGLLVIVTAGVGLLIAGAGEEGPTELVITIPAGTQDRIDAGEDVRLVPEVLRFEVGDTLVLVNEDDAFHAVGPLYVAPHHELVYPFARAGTYTRYCTLHADDQVTILVS